MKAKSQKSRVKSRAMRRVAVAAVLALQVAHCAIAQCVIDPVTGQRICTPSSTSPAGGRDPALDPRRSTLDDSAHCRISVADGSTGSGTLIAVDDSLGLVLSCSHLFDRSTGRIVVSFPNGGRFAARLVDRDRAHDLAALAIRRPENQPVDVSNQEPGDLLTACGFGPNGHFRCVRARVVGRATAAGAVHPSLTMAGAVRPGDSGGAVLNPQGEVVGVVWGQRDGLSYATCGQPVREFLNRIRGRSFVARDASRPVTGPYSPVHGPQADWQAWRSEMESRIRALDEKKQDRGDYLQAGVLDDYVRIADAAKFDPSQFAHRSELDGKLKTLSARFEAVQTGIALVREHVEQVAAGQGGLFQGLSLGKVVVGALGVSGPLAAAIVIAGGLARRRVKRSALRSSTSTSSIPEPVAVDSPPPPQRTVPETHYVPVEKDSFAKAHQWSSEHVARKYPGATEILQAQDSLIKQYLAAR